MNSKIFIIFLLVLPVFLSGLILNQKNLQDELQHNSDIFLTAASLTQAFAKEVLKEEFQAKAVLSLKITPSGKEEILYQKNIQTELPIASLTKLMTALVAWENYDLNSLVRISKEAVSQEEAIGQLRVGETLSVKNLLYIMLIESSNDAAFSLAENMGRDYFVQKMQETAKRIGFTNSNFSEPSGLDENNNYSTSQDLAKLAKYLIQNRPEIFEITQQAKFTLYSPSGDFHHQLSSTDKLLGKIPGIFGGKTGFTEKAGSCLLLVLKNQKEEYFINIILGAKDSFSEMEKLIEMVNYAR